MFAHLRIMTFWKSAGKFDGDTKDERCNYAIASSKWEAGLLNPNPVGFTLVRLHTIQGSFWALLHFDEL